jgi:hypothetical protein
MRVKVDKKTTLDIEIEYLKTVLNELEGSYRYHTDISWLKDIIKYKIDHHTRNKPWPNHTRIIRWVKNYSWLGKLL